MSNNKFHFEFKREFLNIGFFFPSRSKKKNYNYCLSLKFIFFICLKNKNIFFKIIIDANY